MAVAANKIDDIFWNAAQLSAGESRERYLDSACANDRELRQRVEKLLTAQPRIAQFLEKPFCIKATEGADSQHAADQRPDGVGTLIGPYKLLEQIGEGGMGLVFMAEQQRPMRRLVALKLIKPGMDSKQVIARFEAEKQALAMMDHENIAKVFEAGTTDTGRFYFAMELVRGMPINEFCDQQRLSVRERLELFIQVCQAVQHAHQKGIIHRDLKPTNVLVTMNDIVAIPKVIDFGIAKALGQSLTDHTLHTGFAQLVGTPLYMSPEQAKMNQLGVDTRSDVYSLGVLLYELLTGTTPFDKETLSKAGLDEMRRMIREDEPPRPSARMSTLQAPALSTISQRRSTDPRHISTTLRGELDWIVMKALEKDRSRRYESASAFATDIQRYLSDEPVLACPPTTMYRFQKFARKHKPALATAAAIALCLILGTTVSAWQAARATTAEVQANANEQKAVANEVQAKVAAAAEAQQRQRAEANEQKANTQRDEAQKQRDEVKALAERLQRTLFASNMNLAKNAWDQAAVPRVLSLLDQHRPKPGEPDLRGFEWHYLNRLCQADSLLTFYGPEEHHYFLESAAFSPDGKRIVTISTGGSNSGPMIETKTYDPQLKIWDAETGRELLDLKGHTNHISGVVFSPDGKRLASSGADGKLKVWALQTGKELHDLKGHTGYVNSVAFSPDGKRLVSASQDNEDKTVRLWDSETGQELLSFTGTSRFKGSSGDFQSAAFSPNGKRLAHGIDGGLQDGKRAPGEVKVRDAQTGQELLSLQGGGGSLAFSRDGKRLASRSGRGRIAGTPVAEEVKVWDAQTGQEIPSLSEKSDGAIEFALSPDGKRIAVAGVRSRMPRIKVSDAQTGEELFTFQQHTDEITSLTFSPDSKYLATGSKDRTLRIWDLVKGQEIRTVKGQAGDSVDFSPDGQRLVSAKYKGSVKVWDVHQDAETLTLDGTRPAISPDFKRLAGGSAGNTVKIWDAQTGQETMVLNGHTNPVFCIAFSADGRRLVSGGGIDFESQRRAKTQGNKPVPGMVKLWDALTGKELYSFERPSGRIHGVAISTDGKRVASLSGEWKVWDVDTGREQLSTSRGGVGPYPSAAFSPDGKRFATHARDEMANESALKVWDLESGKEILSLKGRGFEMAYSADGKRLASSDGQELKVWDAGTGEELLAFKGGHTNRILSLAFSQDGKRLASASIDGTVKVWDAQTGQETLTFEHTGTIGSNNRLHYGASGPESLNVSFSSDGNKLACLLWDGTVKIWDATPLPEKP